jgi:hypothetical protein
MTHYDDGAVLRTRRAFSGVGLGDGQAYTFPAGALCSVVTPGDGHCEVEFVVPFPDGSECVLATVEDGDAETVPRSAWTALAAE